MTTLRVPRFLAPWRSVLPAWPVLIGLLALFGWSYHDYAGGLWQQPEQAHVPLVALAAVLLFWKLAPALAALPRLPATWGGSLLLGAGLTLTIAGHGSDSPFLVLLSQIPVLMGLLLLFWGSRALGLAWFPIAFLLFMVPLPGILIDALTGQLKEWVSVLAEEILYRLGYPVARSGVVLGIGQYRLLVVDACSGLHSMLSLSALGTLYIYLMRRPSWTHNVLMLTSLLPIAFIANLVRVLLLVLVTYYFGDHMGQWLHEATGIVVFLVALLLLFGVDALLAGLLAWMFRRPR
jgi:exosortase B